MKQIITLVLIVLALILPAVSADIIFQEINQTSQAEIPNLNLDLISAKVTINATEDYFGGNLKAVFIIHSNEKDMVNASVYLKAKGQSCYQGKCRSDDVRQVSFQVRYKEPVIGRECQWMTPEHPFIDWEHYYSCDIYSDDYSTSEGIFQKTESFLIYPNSTFVLYIEEPSLYLPFEYYLDSLSTFNKADYEKITIYGNVTAKFNEKYPVKKISDNEWIWEYSNINTKDESLNDVLIISKSNTPNPEPNKTLIQKIIDWFKNLFS
jgi:hypothetical protein